MLRSDHSSKYDQLKKDLRTAGEQLFTALDRYTGICSTVRNAYHQASFNNPQSARLLWSSVESELFLIPLLEARVGEVAQNLNRVFEMGKAKDSPHSIHDLPDELLALVFRFAAVAKSQHFESTDKPMTRTVPRYPDSIAQTCARWRQVALPCPHLWTRVYLTAHLTRFKPIPNYAELYAKRAGHQPLELRITDIQDDMGPDDDGLEQFIASVAPRTKSLELVRSGLYPSGFEWKTLGGFIKPPNDNAKKWDTEVDLSLEQIERGLAHLTVLHVSQITPMWGSTACQGLVDLRLIPNHKRTYDRPIITVPEFVSILQASPRLRILHFGLYLCMFPPDSPAQGVTVRLNDLEVLYLSASGTRGAEATEREISHVMRHITPGRKPLRLTLDRVHYEDRSALEGIEAFFQRAHIVKFCAKGGTPPPVGLVDCAPDLTQLVFDGCRYDHTYNFCRTRGWLIGIYSWIIRDSLIYAEDLAELVNQYEAVSLVMSNCRFFSKDNGPLEISEPDLENWRCELPDFVQYIYPDSSPDPTVDWNNLD
ncbi:hypothetical protein RSOLAG22IIIB_06668 [Rhizoctonia solani]|uniref:Uncharacterized protein n=1 Tax=Rhizoctonia solani TaxID=456999 RepID=A0A0K6GFS5_9AGAM|nr:hypothetical protein RSOLAG22IIIB_06668 [Rhizoctonia solani]